MTSIGIEHLRQHVRIEVQRHLDKKAANYRPWSALVYRGTPGWSGTETFEEKGFRFRVISAASLLELRCHLSTLDPQGQDKLVVVADLDQRQIPADVRSRLLHANLREIEPWRVLMAEFHATRVDSRIKANQELAIALLQHRPPSGFPAVTTGVLDLATMWGSVCTCVLGLPNGNPTPRDVLVWATDDGVSAKLRAAPASIRDEVLAWMQERSPLASLLVRVATQIPAADLIPVGLVCGVVHHEAISHEPDLLRAQGRLDLITGGAAVTLRDAREWHEESVHALGKLDTDVRLRLRKRADGLLAKVGADAFAAVSAVIPAGYDGRLTAFASTITEYIAGKANDQDLLAACVAVVQHWDGIPDSNRRMKIEMATRLARWLKTPLENPVDLPRTMLMYRDQVAFCDWARHQVVGGDPIPALQKAYAELQERVLVRREQFNRAFAHLVADWSRTPDRYPDVVRIEEVNRRIVADVAADHRVLVLVMDGMSWSVTQELIGDLERRFWTMRTRTVDSVAMPAPVMSTIPSVTEYGRASLLCGQLCQGDANDERRGFAENHDLRSVSSASNPPRLFHRKDLEEPGRQGLSAQVADAIGNLKQRIVGVVVNAVDDYLAKDDGGRRTWDVDSIRVMADLLAVAGDSKRAIVLCADHGHILDHWVSSQSGTPEGGERWHTSAPRDGEVAITGPRSALVAPTLVAPWSERIRYGGKKNGYHGGITPQEVIAPCLVLAKIDDEIEGWQQVYVPQPTWWKMDVEAAPSVRVESIVPIKSKRPDTPGQQSLFSDAAWPQRLITSPIYQMTSAQAGRRRPDDSVVVRILTALDAAPGCQLSERTLAETLNVPVLRMTGIIAQVARMLNVESYRILSYTEDRGHIRLDRQLAITQFELGTL
jgi:hypothetical protein